MNVDSDPRLLALNTIACSVAQGAGGLGWQFAELVEVAESCGLPSFRYIHPSPGPRSDPAYVPVRRWARGGQYLAAIPGTWAYPFFVRAASAGFDLAAARLLTPERKGFTGFASHCLRSFRRARQLGIPFLGMSAPNSHVDNVWRQQNLARSHHPIDRGWLTNSLRRQTIAEYEMADVIFVTSDYEHSTFLEGGVDAGKLIRVHPRAHPRYRPRDSRPSDDTFEIVYVGRMDLIKGIPVLLDAFSAAAGEDWRLTLMGQFSSHGLREYVMRRASEDARITVVEYGDPLPLLQSAHLFVHPSFEDGFGYAPMEALAVGVPVVVTDQTGMAEHVHEGDNGSVVPAGDVRALADRLQMYSSRTRAS